MAKTRNPALEAERKAHILATAHGLLASTSHRELTLDAIAKAAGVSKGMLTYYFASKDEIVVETIGRFLDLHQQALASIVHDERVKPRERLAQLIDAALPGREAIEQNLRFFVEIWSYAKTRPEVMDAVRRTYLAFRAECERIVALGVEQGYVTAADVDFIHIALHALLDGMSFQLMLDPELDVGVLRDKLLRLADRMLTD
jgi:AcrR family transcriptional regulator